MKFQKMRFLFLSVFLSSLALTASAFDHPNQKELFSFPAQHQPLYLSLCERQMEKRCVQPKLKGNENRVACLQEIFLYANRSQKNLDPLIDESDCGKLMVLTKALRGGQR